MGVRQGGGSSSFYFPLYFSSMKEVWPKSLLSEQQQSYLGERYCENSGKIEKYILS